MIEIALGLGCCYTMARVAEADDESGLLWGVVTFLLCVGCVLFVPLPFVRIAGAGFLAFILMFVVKAVRDR
jgi:hypothetical protein